jgi:competence protein ComFC
MKLKELILDLLFPRRCLGCNREGKWLCEKCWMRLMEVDRNRYCKICNKGLSIFHHCNLGELKFFSLLDYQSPLTAQLIAGLKYQYLTDLLDDVFSDLLKIFWNKYQSFFSERFIILPLPIHQRKKLKRGFNQSELLAQKLADISGLRVVNDLMFRKVNNKPQAGSGDLEARRKNTAGIFQIDYSVIEKYRDCRILLLDDVYTTGCTANEAIKTLKNAGFTDISILVLALN